MVPQGQGEVIYECSQKKEGAHHLGGMEDHPKCGATLRKEEWA